MHKNKNKNKNKTKILYDEIKLIIFHIKDLNKFPTFKHNERCYS